MWWKLLRLDLDSQLVECPHGTRFPIPGDKDDAQSGLAAVALGLPLGQLQL